MKYAPPNRLIGEQNVDPRTSPKTNFASPAEFAVPVSNARRWSIITLLFAASMINYMDRATLSMALPVIADDLRLDPTAKGMLASAFFGPTPSCKSPSAGPPIG